MKDRDTWPFEYSTEMIGFTFEGNCINCETKQEKITHKE